MDNRLAFIDQASFLGLRATGQGQLGQFTWIYDRGIDFDGLRCFHDHLCHGLLGRRVERSPLPFGRHRWVSANRSPGIDVAGARARDDVAGWLDERAQVTIDPEFGPGWHLGVLPLQNGGDAVTLVASHTVVDGLGLCRAIADAANGVTREFGYPPARSRTRRQAVLEDIRDTARGAPEVGRALRAAAKLARRERRNGNQQRPPTHQGAVGDRFVVVPTATVYIDAHEWDARVELLGGTSNSLLAGFAAKLAQRVDRVGATDGKVTLSFPVSHRTDDDTRANALSSVDVKVDPAGATRDLRDIRSTVKHALMRHREDPNEFLALLPLTPLVPKVAAAKLAEVAFSYDELPVGCSNVGDLNPAVCRADGSDADAVSLRLVEQGVRKWRLEQMRGQLFFACGRALGKVFITVVGYQVGAENSKSRLRELTSRTLKDFDLTGGIE